MGIYIVLFIILQKQVCFAGFFLPGDSLLFLQRIYNRELIENVLL
jgi:membrane-associated protein